MQNKTGLGELCRTQQPIRATYFSDTYRAALKIGEEAGEWDITHVSIPFDESKRKAFVDRFGPMSDTEFSEYYRELESCIRRSIEISNRLTESGSPDITKLESIAIEPKEEGPGIDIYLITRPQTRIANLFRLNPGDKPTKANILLCAIRLLQIARSAQTRGVSLGAFDLDTTYANAQPNEATVSIDCLIYAGSNMEDSVLPFCLPEHTHPALLDGSNPSLATDVYSVCSIAWTLLNGDCATEEADLSVPPKYASAELVSLLSRGLDECNINAALPDMDNISKKLIRELYDMVKQLRADDTQNICIPLQGKTYAIHHDTVVQPAAAAEMDVEDIRLPPQRPPEDSAVPEEAALVDEETDPAEDISFPDEDVGGSGKHLLVSARQSRKQHAEFVEKAAKYNNDAEGEGPESPAAKEPAAEAPIKNKLSLRERMAKMPALKNAVTTAAAILACAALTLVFYWLLP